MPTEVKYDPYVCKYGNLGTSTSGVVGEYHNTYFGQSPRRIRIKNPNWRSLVAHRQDASNAYFRRALDFTNVPIQQWARFWHPGRGSWVEGSCGLYCSSSDGNVLLGVNEADDLALKDLALKRLKSKLSSRSNQMQVLVPVVELREFRGLITALTFSLHDLVYALLTIKRSKGKSAAKFAAHAWLTWSFALSPTLSDIKQLASTISDVLERSGGDVFTDYGSAKKVWHSVSTDSMSSVYFCNSKVTVDLNHTLSYRYVAGYKTPLRSANDYNAVQDFGLELGALPSVGWELTPFSWLLDYFSTFGEYLDDTFTSDGVNTVYVNCTKRYTCRGQYFSEVIPNGYPSFSSTSSGRGSRFVWDVTDRTVLSALPRRALRLKTVDEIGKNAMNKLLNLGSVLVGGKALSSKF